MDIQEAIERVRAGADADEIADELLEKGRIRKFLKKHKRKIAGAAAAAAGVAGAVALRKRRRIDPVAFRLGLRKKTVFDIGRGI